MTMPISINPFQCRMWSGHDRLEEHINEATCRDEIASFQSRGQQLPVLARALRSDPTHEYELIYGARRLFVARHLNLPLLVQIRELSDREAVLALDMENRLRKDLSPYERGRSYNVWLRTGVFSSQEELARTLNISSSQVSRLLRLAQLPTVVVNAFSSPLEICENWGRSLMEIWDDPSKRSRLARTARAIANNAYEHEAAAVFRMLVAEPTDGRPREPVTTFESHDEVVKDQDGNPLFRVRQHRKDTALLLPSNSTSTQVLSEIKLEVAAILHRARSQGADFGQHSSTDSSEPLMVSRSVA
jgi:ParB family transcriptional regulator, chromosome partitioning protein